MNNPVQQETESLISSQEYFDTYSTTSQANNSSQVNLNNTSENNVNPKVIVTQPKSSTSNLTSGLAEPTVDVATRTRFGHSCNNCTCCNFYTGGEGPEQQWQSAS